MSTFSKKRGGVDPKVYIFEILNFGKFQVSKWAFKVSFKKVKKVFLAEKKSDKNDFEKSLHFEGGGTEGQISG